MMDPSRLQAPPAVTFSGRRLARPLALLLFAQLAACRAAPPSAPGGAGLAPRAPLSPAELAQREVAVGFLMIDGVYNTELMAPFDVFQHTVFHVDPGMRVFTVAPSPDPVRTFEGLRILPDATFDTCPPLDVLVVPSAESNMEGDLEDQRLLDFVRAAGRQASYVMSLCDGAFLLAGAGLLDGRQATTFPADIARLRSMFPQVDVRAGVSFVHDGRAITSAGGAKSYEPALYLCELLYGAEKARGIADGLVIDWDLEQVEHRVRRGP